MSDINAIKNDPNMSQNIEKIVEEFKVFIISY